MSAALTHRRARALAGRGLLAIAIAPGLAGCAAMIAPTGTDTAEIVNPSSTDPQIQARLGAPLRSETIAPRVASDLWKADHEISVMSPRATVVSRSTYAFRGRLGKNDRKVQYSFDSFMTLGLAEVFLIPKALWERATDEDLELTVWFDGDGRAGAYQWTAAAKR